MPVTLAARIYALLALVGLTIAAPASAAVPRAAELRTVEYRGNGIARLRLVVYEREGEARFPISTLDRQSIEVHIAGGEHLPVDVGSLSTVGADPGQTRRAMVVVFNGGFMRGDDDAEGIRNAVADILPTLPAAHLAVAAISSEIREIVETAPGSNENIVRVQRDVLADEPSGESLSRTGALCYAADKFKSWDLSDLSASDQKVVIVAGARGVGGRTKTAEGGTRDCAAELTKLGIAIYDVGWLDSSGSGIVSGGGFAQRVKGPQDVEPALSTVAANLNGEYLVDVTLPELPRELQPATLDVKVSYHDGVMRTNARKLSKVIEELLPPPPPPPPAPAIQPEPKVFGVPRWIALAISGLIVLASAAAIGVRTAKRMKTVGCNACGRRVDKEHRQCPFRDKKVVARLVVLDGKYAGRTLPLHTGDNHLSRFGWKNSLPISGKGVALQSHAVVRIEGVKALYVPAGRRRSIHRINGWPVREPRLLGSGHVLQLGQRRVRFEVRPDAWRNA